MLQLGELRCARVFEHRAGGVCRQRFQFQRAEPLLKRLRRDRVQPAFQFRLGDRKAMCTQPLRQSVFGLFSWRHQHLCRSVPYKFRLESAAAGELRRAEVASRDVEQRQSEAAVTLEHGGEEVVPRVEQRAFDDGAGADDTSHTALHQSTSRLGILQLVANSDAVATANELR